MPKKRRRTRIPTPAWERPRGTIARRLLGRGSQFYGLVVVVLVAGAALGAIGYGLYAKESEKWGRPGSTAIQVEDTRYRLDYFANRMTMFVNQNGGQATDPNQRANSLSAVSSLLIREEMVRRFAGELDVTATDDETNEEIASRLGITADDEDFDVVLQQELARSKLSETDYRQMAEAAVLEAKLKEHFLAEVPKSAESVRYRQILVSDQATADNIKQQIEDGKDFAALAAENSLDPATKDKGGNVGWVPRGALDPSIEELLFVLKAGEITVIPAGSGVMVIEMLKKDDDHPVEKDQKETLADGLFADWVDEKRQSLPVVNNMDPNSGDIDKINWAIDGDRG